ncbi:MAG TPA: glutamate mutase L, partial [Casimicrobiaceae bacterium]|nr:glutamate mutase L [Casimicrobiaceae bacterium]
MSARASPATTTAIDIGSTVVKVARLDADERLVEQRFFPRDFDAGIARQVRSVLGELGIDADRDRVLVCSSANGGLRVGIIALTRQFSGTALRNQVLLAGANPVFTHELEHADGDTRKVDVLLVGGGIDCEDAEPTARRLQGFEPGRYRFGALVYAGNRHLAESFARRFPIANIIANPLGTTLSSRVGSVFETIRRAYLDDLVLKEGISELPERLARTVRPTPEVASRGLLRSMSNRSTFTIVGGCVVLDIGGATTDLHYTTDVVSDASPVRPATGVSVARHVYTDLGIVASRDTLLLQLRNHPQLYEFLAALPDIDVREAYAGLREGEFAPSQQLLSYACIFLALDR